MTAGEFLEFMNDGGYSRPDLWLSLGWSIVREQAMDGAACTGSSGTEIGMTLPSADCDD